MNPNYLDGFFLLSSEGTPPDQIRALLERLGLKLMMLRSYDWYDVQTREMRPYGQAVVERLKDAGIVVVAHLELGHFVEQPAELASHIRQAGFEGLYFDAAESVEPDVRQQFIREMKRSLPEILYWQSSLYGQYEHDTRSGQVDYWDDSANRWPGPYPPTSLFARRHSPKDAMDGLVHLLPILGQNNIRPDLGWFGPKVHVTEAGAGFHDRDATLWEWKYHAKIARHHPVSMMLRSTWSDWHSMPCRWFKEWIIRRVTAA